jgi:hypothetical protein
VSDQFKASVASPEATDVGQLYWEEWQRGAAADLSKFLDRVGPLSPAQLAGVLCVDLRERWRRQERRTADQYFRDFPKLRDDGAALDLIYAEYLMRDEAGEYPKLEQFLGRFPELAEKLRPRLEVHQALGGFRQAAVEMLGLPASGGDSVGPQETPAAAAGSKATDKAVPAGPLSVWSSDVTEKPLPVLAENFGRYRLVKLLGRGGMGEVYLAHDTQLGRDVALKVMRGYQQDPAAVERFYREARVAAALEHPNLCPIFDVGERDGIPFLTMPRLRGESLALRLKRDGALPPSIAIRITISVAQAVAKAHHAGIVHRDLKPANVMIDESGRPIVMDFGLARRCSSNDPRLTESGFLTGTPAYIAPERIGGEPAVPSPTSDVYSLGVMLYEMLTGRLPFPGKSAGEVLRKALTVDPEPVEQRCPGLDPRLAETCRKAMAREPEQRFALMDALAAALEEITGESSVAVEKTRVPTPRLAGKRHKAVLVAVACAVAFAALALVWWLVYSRTPVVIAGDAMQVGSQWEGEFHWGGVATKDSGVLLVKITERQGEKFRGTYLANPGNYGWLISGTIRDNQVEWRFDDILKDTNGFADLVRDGSVVGTLKGETLVGQFEDRGDKTKANVTMKLKK